MTNPIARVKKTLYGLLCVDSTVTEGAVEAGYNTIIHVTQAALAGTAAAAETAIAPMPTGWKIKSAYISSLTGSVGGSTQYATCTLYRNRSGTATAIAAWSDTDGLGTAIPEAFTLVATAAVGTVGDIISYAFTKSGAAGDSLGITNISVLLERMDP